ncbi:MAG: GatB/YqeY domain-containing protein [Alphaproteobacteria bacterium]|nr:GatB/YqeY domain-containing protein [Alphaproteobacteria bacterium]
MLRQKLNDALKDSLKKREARAVSTLRLILAALKDRDIDSRGRGIEGGLGDEEILGLLQTMIKQRRESITQYQAGAREDLVKQEAEEIAIIEGFLPKQLSAEEIAAAVAEAIRETGAAGLKEMGKVMAVLKAKHSGRMDFSKASAAVKAKLGG